MTRTTASLNRQMASAGDLQSVVRTMKALAASSIGQYEKSVQALGDYYHTVELALSVCFRAPGTVSLLSAQPARAEGAAVSAIVFGSDQGLVGRFNDVVADYAVKALQSITNTPQVWAVGERVHARLTDAGIQPIGVFVVPNSIEAITALVGKILLAHEAHHASDASAQLQLFYNRPTSGSAYEPVSQRLLPLDAAWLRKLAAIPWPTTMLPEVIGANAQTVRALIREYLFVSLFRASAESLASENASRLAAMQRADKNIDDLLENLQHAFHRLRQSRIDEELFDVIAGFEALGGAPGHR
ncbi:MAG: F0F1 ATP synthase subunit gamma [Gemmatimonadaceae bacterium]